MKSKNREKKQYFIKERYKIKEIRYALLFLAPSLIGVSIFVFIPFLDVIRRSFFDTLCNQFKGFGNYMSVLSNDAFVLAVKNTLCFCLVCIPVMLVLSLLVSLMLQRITVFSKLFKTMFLLPMAIPVASVVVLWKVLFYDQGVINSLLVQFGLDQVNWMNSGASFFMLVISYTWKNMGYFMILWLAGLSIIPSSIYEAAALDGAGRMQIFRYITLPNLRGTLVMNLILAFVNSFKVFREAYLVAGEYPEEHIYLLQHLFNNWFSQLDMEKMTAGAVLVTVVVSAFIIIVFRLERRGEADDSE